MSLSRLPLPAGLILATMLAACAPTTTGIQARVDARNRLDLMNAQLNYDQAEQSFEVGRFERAERAIDDAITMYPDAANFHLLRGRILVETNRLDEAVEAFDTAIEKDAECADAHYFAGIVYQRWSDDEQAWKHYAEAQAIDPANVQFLLATAESLVALGELDAARAEIEPKLDRFEHHAAMHHLLGQVALLQGDTGTAADCYARACMLSPDDASLREELARAQYQAGRHQDCFETLQSWRLATGEKRLDLMLLEARCLALLDRAIDARNIYLDLTRESPQDVNIWIELGTIAWEIGDYHRVAQCSVRAIALAPDRFEGYMLRGINERYHGDLTEAIGQFTKSAERASNTALPHILLGLSFEEDGQLAAAGQAYAAAVRIDPDNQEAAQLLARWQRGSRMSTAPSDH